MMEICKNCGKEIIPCNGVGHDYSYWQERCKGYIHLKGDYYHKCDIFVESPIAEIDLNPSPAKPLSQTSEQVNSGENVGSASLETGGRFKKEV